MQFIKQAKLFLIIYSVFLILAGVLLLSFSKTDIHLFINSYHHPFFDYFFKYFTHLGDGLLVIIVGLIFLLVKYRYGLFILSSYLSASIVVQILKRIIFTDVNRPLSVLGHDVLRLVDGVYVNSRLSFPSGHSASAFVLFMSLLLITKNKHLQIALFVSAFVVGYSRMYLSQHFLIDVYFGSLIGFISVWICYKYVYCSEKKWLDRTLLKR